MNINEIIPDELIPALAWLGKQDWLGYRMHASEHRTEIGDIVILPAPEAERFWPAVAQIVEIVSADQVSALSMFSLSKALAQGPKVLKVTAEQCRAMERVDVNVRFADYQQPYPAIFIELPGEYRKDLSDRFKIRCPKTVLCYHDSRTGYLVVTAYSPGGAITNILPPRPEYETIELALKQEGDIGSDIDIADVVQRLAINFCLMLVHLGVVVAGPANPGMQKKLQKATGNRKRGKAEKAKALLSVTPKLIGFAQDVTLFGPPSGNEDGNRSDRGEESASRSPHWRRGHFRHQRVGKGRTDMKLIFIRPVLVNRKHFAGDEKDTQVTYHNSRQPQSNSGYETHEAKA